MLEAVIAETGRWPALGQSCFAEQIEARGFSPPNGKSSPEQKSLLDRVILAADR